VRDRKFFKRKCELWLIKAIAGLARMLPRRAGHRLFSGLGGVVGRLFRKDRERAIANLAIAFPQSPAMVRRAMAAAMFKNLGRNVYDFLNLKGASREKLASLVAEVRGMEWFQQAAAVGKGVIVITGHIGCWELMPPYFVSLGHAATVVGRKMKIQELNDELVAMRASLGVTTLDRDTSPREMIRPLERGEILGVLIDQHTSVGGTYVPFFGKPAFTPTGVAKLACLTGSPIVPMADFLGHDGKHTIHVLPPIEPPRPERKSDKSAVVESLTAECSLAVEQLIRIDPKQWVWFHHRWREPEQHVDKDVKLAANA
jgi:KDO2-lipid IV(A) lauroyltransferase